MNIDLEIAKKCKMLDISDVANKLDISDKYIENYGKYKAKISLDIMNDIKEGELSLSAVWEELYKGEKALPDHLNFRMYEEVGHGKKYFL